MPNRPVDVLPGLTGNPWRRLDARKRFKRENVERQGGPGQETRIPYPSSHNFSASGGFLFLPEEMRLAEGGEGRSSPKTVGVEERCQEKETSRFSP